MNPLDIFEAVILALEAAADGLNPKRKQQAKHDHRRFLFWYILLMFLGAALVVWIVYDLYFAK